MDKIKLSDNHKRSVSASMFLVEKLIDEIEYELHHYHEKVMISINDGTESADLQYFALLVQEIKSYIRFMVDKYDLQPTQYNFSQIINSRKSKMWEILSNTQSKSLKGFGEFPPEYAKEFDSDIENLLKLTESI